MSTPIPLFSLFITGRSGTLIGPRKRLIDVFVSFSWAPPPLYAGISNTWFRFLFRDRVSSLVFSP